MRACFATALFCSFACLVGGCSLTTKFDHFKFGSAGSSAAGSSAADGGMIDSGSATDSGSARDASVVVDSGSSGNAASGAGGARAGTGGDAAGASGAGGQGPATCVTDSDCGDPATFNCVLKHCLLRRLPSGTWFSGGGGITQSASFVVRASIGAPAPMGNTTSGNFSITVGPGAGRP